MSPIRYERRGLRIVRVEPDETGPSSPVAGEGPEDYRLRLHRFASEIRGAVRRYRQPTYGITPALVREARRRAGIGQWQLAQKLGISRSTIAEAEIGRRPIHKLLAEWAAQVLRSEGDTP